MSKYMAFIANDRNNIAKNTKNTGDDDWETDASYVNDISEKDQRWGSKEIGGKAKEVVNMNDLRNKVKETDDKAAKDELTKKPGSAYGYGGKFGVQTDRMDKSAHSNTVEDDKGSKNTSYKPQGPLQDTKSAAKVFEQKAAANKPDPPRVAAPKTTPVNKFTAPVAAPVAPKPTPVNKFSAPVAPPAAAKPMAPKPKIPEPEPEPEYVPEPEPVYVEAVRMPDPEPEPEPIQSNDDWSEPASTVPEPPVAPVEEWPTEEPPQNIETEQPLVEEAYPPEQPQASGDLPAQARALYDFDSQDTEELGFKAGDIINIIQAVDAEWWQGEVDGRQGIFPVSYVEAL